MTAEVGVMNRIGVALAADSAVSLGRSADKIYTSADKLFHLSRTAPVGIMINGNANFLGVPWETTIKSFRAHLGDKRFPHLSQYADAFIGYLRTQRKIFPIHDQDANALTFAYSLLENVRAHLKSELDREAEERDGLEEKDIPPIIERVVSARMRRIRTYAFVPGLGPSQRALLRKRYAKARVRRSENDHIDVAENCLNRY